MKYKSSLQLIHNILVYLHVISAVVNGACPMKYQAWGNSEGWVHRGALLYLCNSSEYQKLIQSKQQEQYTTVVLCPGQWWTVWLSYSLQPQAKITQLKHLLCFLCQILIPGILPAPVAPSARVLHGNRLSAQAKGVTGPGTVSKPGQLRLRFLLLNSSFSNIIFLEHSQSIP